MNATEMEYKVLCLDIKVKRRKEGSVRFRQCIVMQISSIPPAKQTNRILFCMMSGGNVEFSLGDKSVVNRRSCSITFDPTSCWS